jgi:hypothetical protein
MKSDSIRNNQKSLDDIGFYIYHILGENRMERHADTTDQYQMAQEAFRAQVKQVPESEKELLAATMILPVHVVAGLLEGIRYMRISILNLGQLCLDQNDNSETPDRSVKQAKMVQMIAEVLDAVPECIRKVTQGLDGELNPYEATTEKELNMSIEEYLEYKRQ